MITTILTTLFLCGTDKLLEYLNLNGRYYFNHFLVNSLITVSCFNDIILPYTQFNNIINIPINMIAVEYTYSIHFYHILMYYKKFVFDDWLHHIIMIFFALPFGTILPCGPILSHSLFFLTGLPGGINYLLLFLQRNNIIGKQTQKYCNYQLNLLVRQPGCIATSVLSLIYMNRFNLSLIEKIMGTYIILTHYWNGIYFMNQVITNYNLLYPTV